MAKNLQLIQISKLLDEWDEKFFQKIPNTDNLDELISEYYTHEGQPDSDGLRISLAIVILKHLKHDSLDLAKAKQIYFEAIRLLNNCGGSRLTPAWTPIYSKLDVAWSQFLAVTEDNEDQLWYENLSQENSDQKAELEQINHARANLRLGYTNIALGALLKVPNNPDAALLAIKAARMLGRLDLHSQLMHEFKEKYPDPSSESSLGAMWEDQLSQFFHQKDLYPLIKLTRKGGLLHHPDYQLMVYLISYSSFDRKSLASLQSPKNINRTSKIDKGTATYKLFRATQRIDEMEEQTDDVDKRLEHLKQLIQQSASLPSLETELLCLLAAAYTLHRMNFKNLSFFTFQKYQKICLACTNGISTDVWNLGSDLQESFEESNTSNLSSKEAEASVHHHSNLKRYLMIGKVSTTITSKALQSRFKRLFVNQRRGQRIKAETQAICTQILSENLAKMRGGWMKITQLGVSFDNYLPPNIQDRLAELCYNAEHMPESEVNGIFIDSLKEKPTKLFKEWNYQAIAAGSIGQVHEATTTDNHRVAVKVMYSNIKKCINNDFKVLRSFSWILNAIYPDYEIKKILHNWESIMLSECDYRTESSFQKLHEQIFQNTPEIHVPKVYEYLSSEDVLTMEYAEGDGLNDFLDYATEADRNEIGKLIMKSALFAMGHGYLKYDFHQGNYRFQRDSIALLDFGALCKIGPDQPIDLLSLIKIVMDDDFDSFATYVKDRGFVNKTDEYDMQTEFNLHKDLYFKPFMSDSFKFTKKFNTDVFEWQTQKSPNVQAMTLPPEQIQLLRFYWSLYGILAKIEPEANWREIIQEAFEIKQKLPLAS